MANDVWVLADLNRQEVQTVSFEMLDEGRKIANGLKGQLTALVLGHALPELVTTQAGYVADLVYLVDHPLLAEAGRLESLNEELDRVRLRGVAFSAGELLPGGAAVAAPVFGAAAG